jgi:hypothetical protein
MTAGGQSPDLRHWIGEIARKVLGEPNKLLSTQQQLRFGSNGSVAVEISGGKRGQWYDHEAAVGGGPWELLTVKGRMTAAEAVEWLRSELGIKFDDEEIVAIHEYRDERGDLLQQVVRFEPKAFRQRRPDGKGGWTWSVKGLRRVPYRLPELIAAPADCIVFVVEGEKDVDQLTNLELVATCNAGGAAKRRNDGKPGRSKWRPELNPFFKGRDVVIVPDNDDAGRDHARSVASNLAPVAARVRLIELPNLAPKGDVSDWLDAGGTREALERLSADAPVFSPEDGAEAAADQGADLDDEAEIARLAKLPRLQYEREREAAAQKLGIVRVTVLDRLVDAKRREGNAGDTAGQGRRLEIADIELWPDQVAGAALLDEIAATIRRHVILDEAAADAAALWVLHTHALSAAYVAPRLAITSPEKRCGKTTLLTLLSALAARPLATANMTAATIFRVIDAARPTLLIDEADSFLGDAEDMRGIVNAGHCRASATVLRTAETSDGYEVRAFAVWGAVAIAAIGRLPGTIEDRAVKISMRRRRPDEVVDRVRLDRLDELAPIARRAARWVTDHLAELQAADPGVPGELHDRAADNWRVLLAIADEAGGDWPERARKAAVALTLAGADDAETTRIALLTDIQGAFDAKGVDRLASEDLVSYLVGLDERPWPESGNGKPITKTQVARLLKPLRISPGTIRLDDGRTAKGYYRSAFEDAFVRWLPPIQNVTPSQAKEAAAFGANRNVTSLSDVTFRNWENPSVSAGCDVVTDDIPFLWREKV